MKNLLLFLGIILIVACTPGRSDRTMLFHIDCDSCRISLTNEWHSSDGHTVESVYSGPVVGSKSATFNRFDTPTSCVRLISFANYAGTPYQYWFIEDGDTLYTDTIFNNICH